MVKRALLHDKNDRISTSVNNNNTSKTITNIKDPKVTQNR